VVSIGERLAAARPTLATCARPPVDERLGLVLSTTALVIAVAATDGPVIA
jgi:hypothetical protein